MNFLKTSILSGLSTIIRILSGLVVNKIIAIYIGPAGIALIGHFQNILGMITTAGTGAINSGLTKYIAENNNNFSKRNEYLSAGLIITFLCSTLVGIIIFILSKRLSLSVLKSEEYTIIFKVLSINLMFISLNIFLQGMLNGLKKIKELIITNILGSIIGLIVSLTLTIKFGLFGALLSMVLTQPIILIVTLFFTYKSNSFSKFQFKIQVNKDIYQKLLHYTLMALVTMATVPVVQIAIRNYIIENVSVREAGYWQGVWKISEIYLSVLTTAFSTYYLPRLSEIKSKIELRNEILLAYKVIIPFVVLGAIGIYLFRDLIITALFSREFIDMKPLFTFQLIGDFLKMSSWALSFLMVAKAMTKTFIITEIIFSASFYVLSITFIKLYGVIGVTYAYTLNYFIYLILMLILFSRILFIKGSCNEKNTA